jgi:hypothetical protein
MDLMTSHPMGRAKLRWTMVIATAACIASAGTASASSIAVTAEPNPTVRGATVTLTNSGYTNPAAPEASNELFDYYEPNTAACPPTAADARQRSSGSGFITTLEIVQNPTFSFSLQTSFVPAAGAHTYRICAYLYTGGDDSVAPDAVASTLLSIPPTRSELLARAIKKCHSGKSRSRRSRCVALARRHYGVKR